MPDKYSVLAPFYDALSGEYPVYRAGRRAGIAALAPRPGDQVLDVGCGTGLNFALLMDAVGPHGMIVGVDTSARMLARARHRVRRRGWRNMILLEADASTMRREDITGRITAAGGRELSDAALASYALSLMPGWPGAWGCMLELCTPTAVLAVVDLAEPTGVWSVFAPLARLACRLGGSDITAHPWRAVERDCADVVATTARGGHLQIRAGRKGPAPGGTGPSGGRGAPVPGPAHGTGHRGDGPPLLR